jgi:hypothetical protein
VETPPVKRLFENFVFQIGSGGVLLGACIPETR